MNPLNRILLGIGVALASLVAIAVLALLLINAHLKVQLAEAQANDTACQIANDDFRRKAEQQNLAIASWQTASEARERRAEDASNAAEKKAAAFRADAEKLRRQKSSGDGCKAANALIDRYRAGIK